MNEARPEGLLSFERKVMNTFIRIMQSVTIYALLSLVIWFPLAISRTMELRNPWNSGLKYLLMASFKGGDNSTDPRRCTAHSRQTGKRCKNASIPGGRVCRYHGGAAPHVQKKAKARLRELEYPAVEAIARILEPPGPKNPHAAALRVSTVLNAAKIVLDRTLDDEDEPPANTLIDVSQLSTPLLKMLNAELEEIQRRESRAMAALPSPMVRKA
jgi:hypothetical protein